MTVIEPVLLAPEAVELIGAAALPVVEALDAPVAPRHVALAVRMPLETLVSLGDLPRDTRLTARDALASARGILAAEDVSSERTAYAQLLRTMRELLLRASLPAPKELGEGDGPTG